MRAIEVRSMLTWPETRCMPRVDARWCESARFVDGYGRSCSLCVSISRHETSFRQGPDVERCESIVGFSQEAARGPNQMDAFRGLKSDERNGCV